MAKLGRPRKLSKRLRIPSYSLEKNLRGEGFQSIAGVDEVGRGAWAGPLYAAAVILPEKRLYKIRDSKLLSREEREELAEKIKREAVGYGYGQVTVTELVELGMHQGTLLAFKRALEELEDFDYILTDYYRLEYLNRPSQNIVRGDQECLSVASASIIAKVERDRVMTKISKENPQYDLKHNKGYPSPAHQQALRKFGPSLVHRPNFAPIKKLQI